MRPVYWFEEVKQELVKHIGSSAWRIGQLKNLEVSSAPGFILSSVFTDNFLDETQNAKLKSQLLKQLVMLEKNTGKNLDSENKPLILSVYPSHFDNLVDGIEPIVNVGLNDQTVEGLAEYYHRPKFAYLTYIRFVAEFSECILDVEFPLIDQQVKRFNELYDLEIKDMLELCHIIKNLPLQLKGVEFPESALDQLELIVLKKVSQWQNETLADYRRSIEMDADLGLSLVVREQKFSNLGEDSADVKILTRDPETGEKKLVISGFRSWQRYSKFPFKKEYSKVTTFIDGAHAKELSEIVDVLETYFCDGLEINLIIEDNKFFVNQVKPLKKTPRAELKIAMDLHLEQNKDLKITSKSVVLQNLAKYFNPEVEVSQVSVEICSIESLTNKSIIGKLTTDSGLDLGSKILVIDQDNTNFQTDLNNCDALLVLNKYYCFKTILEAKKRMIPVFASNQMYIQDGVIKTHSGINIRNGAEVTLSHRHEFMYAGALPLLEVKPENELQQFNDELNKLLKTQFGLMCTTRKDVTLASTFGAKNVQMMFKDVTTSGELAIIRSELSFLINQNPNIKLSFMVCREQFLHSPELVLTQIMALLEASINNGATNKITLVLDASVDNLGYKTILDWIYKSIKTEHASELNEIRIMTVGSAIGHLDMKTVDNRITGVQVDLNSILEDCYKSKLTKKGELYKNILSGLHISNLRTESTLREIISSVLKGRSKGVKFEFLYDQTMNHEWMREVYNLDSDMFYTTKQSLTNNKILMLQA